VIVRQFQEEERNSLVSSDLELKPVLLTQVVQQPLNHQLGASNAEELLRLINVAKGEATAAEVRREECRSWVTL
jgi:hypothetical protein